ncbi:MAG: hypothetical protein ACR2PL_24680 [Dehalococcoidia bacterium]
MMTHTERVAKLHALGHEIIEFSEPLTHLRMTEDQIDDVLAEMHEVIDTLDGFVHWIAYELEWQDGGRDEMQE